MDIPIEECVGCEGPGHHDQCPLGDVIDPLVITDDAGRLLFRLRRDGTAEMPDPAKARMAAAIFWREVLHMAHAMDIPIGFTGADTRQLAQGGQR